MAWHAEETIGLEMVARGLIQELSDRLSCQRVAQRKVIDGDETCADLLVTSAALGAATITERPCSACKALYHARLALGAMEALRAARAAESIAHSKGTKKKHSQKDTA